MSKGIDDLKDWAMHNVRLISILPSNKNLPVDTKLTDVLEHDVDEKYFLSDERVEQLNFNAKRDSDIKQIAQYDTEKRINANAFRVYDTTGISPTLNTMQGGNLEPCVRVEGVADRINKRQNGRRFKEDGEPMFTLTSQDRHGIAIREATKKGYAIAEPGDSVNISFPDSETRRGRVGKQTANTLLTGEEQAVVLGGVYTQASKDFQRPPLKGLSRTLKANKHDAAVTDGFRIRKLTEKECWRLQGFTDEQFYKAKNSGVSNSQLYKQAGNSVTVNVIDAIAKKLL